jgi:putative Holliday junction resolvase
MNTPVKTYTNSWIMAFDFGMQRIGVAIGNTQLKIPHPIDTVIGKSKFEKMDKIAKLIDKWKPALLVVGIPSATKESLLVVSDAKDSDAAQEITNAKAELLNSIRRFSNRLTAKFKLPVELINEDYSSSIASYKLNEQTIRGIAQKVRLDTIAACVILQFYFDLLEAK